MKLGMWFAVTINYDTIQFQYNRTINRNVKACEEVYLSVVVGQSSFVYSVLFLLLFHSITLGPCGICSM